MNAPKRLILVDGSSYLYRAFHALPPLSTAKGQPTGAIRGVISMLKTLLKEYQPEHMAVVFDAKGKTFRDDLYPDYKANRPPMPDDLRAQVEPLHDAIRKMGLPLVMMEGVEADDVIGTLCQQAAAAGMETIVSTGDKDMAQLVNPQVTLINTMSNTVMDRQGVVEKFGVPPERIIDYLALIGDTVDNVPGVAKCGPKTALKWLQAYDTLEGVMANAQDIKGKVGENLQAALDYLPLAKQLVTIKLDVVLPVALDDLRRTDPDEDALRQVYSELEFRSWLAELEGDAPTKAAELAKPADVAVNYDIITDLPALEAWLARLQAADAFAFDTETTSLNYMQAELVGVSFALTAGEAAYVPVAHNYPGAPDQLPREQVLALLKPLLEAEKPAKIGQNIKYDQSVLARYGIEMQGLAFDTMLESYVLDSVATRHDMDSLASKFLNYTTVHFEDIAGKGAKQLTFDQISLDAAGHYAAEDADITLRLHQELWPRIAQEKSLTSVFTDIEMPLVPVLSRIERRGALIDVQRLRQQSQTLATQMLALQEEAYELAGERFNLGSTQQLGAILYEKMQLPVVKKTPKGAPSTAEPVLQELALDYPLPRVIMAYRSLSKLKSTYTDKLPLQVNPRTGRIHTSYHQAVAATGRLSSSDPNLQNIPIRTEEGRKIRQAFVAAPGHRLLAADYSQIELRIMAHLSGDAGLVNAFQQGLDIHKATAAEVAGIAIDEVSADQRRNAKAINFGLIYGMSAFGLAKQLGISRTDAQHYIDTYFARYTGVQDYMQRIRAQAAEQGYVETLFGRRLYLPDIKARNPMLRQGAERTAINAPMQGTAADIIKRAMISVDAWLRDVDLGAFMIMQVHDELVLEVPEEAIDQVSQGLQQRMSAAAELSVPLLVEVGVGENWDQAH